MEQITRVKEVIPTKRPPPKGGGRLVGGKGMIYLWVVGKGWKEFELSNTAELEKRGILIGDGETPIIIYIIGSRYSVSYWGEDRVDIGCQDRSISEWLTNYKDIAAENNFTDEQIREYRGYVEFIKSIHDREAAEPAAGKEQAAG
jgi:hypothetical protein